MRLTVAGDYLPSDYADIDQATLRKIRDDGFTGTMAGPDQLEALGTEGRKRLRGMLEDEGVDIVSWFVVTPSHIRPDHPNRKKDVARFRRSVDLSQEIGCTSIGTSAGSFDPRGGWVAHPDNWGQRGLELLADSLREITKFFDDSGVYLCLEFGSATVLNSPERVRWVIDEVGSPALKAYADPANWVHGYDLLFDNATMIGHAFDVLGDSIFAAHARDAWVEAEDFGGAEGMHIVTGAAGDGLFDYGTFLKRANEVDSSMWMLIEHTPPDKILSARDHIRSVAKDVGVALD